MLHRSAHVQAECGFIALLHTLPAEVQSGEGILCVFVALGDRFAKPSGCRLIILFRAESRRVHFADPVFHISVFLHRLDVLKSGEGLGIPAEGRASVDLHTQPVRIHSAKVVHGEGVTILRFLPEQPEGLLEVRLRLIAAEEKRAGLLVTVIPRDVGLVGRSPIGIRRRCIVRNAVIRGTILIHDCFRRLR